MFGRKDSQEDRTETAAGDMAAAEDRAAVEADGPETGSREDEGATSASPAAQTGADGAPVEEVEEVPEDPSLGLSEELEALNDRYLRLAAEFDNFRRRTRRESADLSVMAQMELARRILPAMDDLARVAAIPNETTTVEALDQGIELILRNLAKELAEVGLERIEALGERFDPELHQGMMVTATDEPELDDIVSRVFVEGYQLRGRLVRPAQVEVLSYDPDGAGDA